MPAWNGCRKAWILLDHLCAEIEGVHEALEDSECNELSGYNRCAMLTVCADVLWDKIWENVNPGLDRILSFGRPEEEIATLICCSCEGLQGLYKYLEVLVKQGGIFGGLLEGKVEALITAMAMPNNGTHVSLQASPSVPSYAGVYLPMPDGVLPYSAYPFMLHEKFVLPWNFHVVDYQMSMQSIHCKEVQSTESDSCEACLQLLTHQIVEGIICQIETGINASTSYVYQPIGGPIEILQKKSAMLDGLRFKQLSTLQTLAACAQTVGQYEQLVMAMGRPQPQTGGVRRMMELLNHARKGLYKPKSFTKEEVSCRLLFLRLGGAHVARLAHQTLSTPTPSMLCYGLQEFAWEFWMLVKERLQWDPSTNRILGLFQKHTEHVGLDFCSMSDVQALVHGILCGEIHHASELCLMNLLVGNNDIMANKDPKHVMKCCRNFSIHKSGVMVNGFMVTPALLHFHLQANKVPPHCIDYLLNPTDRQDVPVKICNPDGTFYLILNGTDRIEDGNGNVHSKGDHITPDSWQGCVDLRNVSLVTAWNLGCQMISSEFVAINIESILQELEHKGYEMEFPFSQVPESADEYNDEYNGDHSPIAPDMQSLSAQDMTTILFLLNPGEGHMLRWAQATTLYLTWRTMHPSKPAMMDQGKFSPFIDIENGKEVPKARVLCKLERATFSKVPGSIDCLNRCARLSHYTKTATLSDLACGLIDSMSEVLLSIGDPTAMVVQCDGQFFLAFIQINEILVDTSPVLEISPQFLMEPTVTIQFQIYQIIETSQVNPNVDSADWKWNRKLEHTLLKTTGSFIQVINPAIAIPEINSPMSYKPSVQCLFSSISDHNRCQLPRLKRSDQFPYCTNTGLGAHCCLAHAAFLCEAEVNEHPITGSAGAQSDHCSAMHVPLAPMLILFVKRKGGRESTADQRAHFSWPKPHREVVLLSGSNRVHQFTLYQHPDHLPSCPLTSAAVWKYIMKIHLARVHPSTKGGDFHQVYMISKSEKATLKLLWEKLLWHLSSSDNAAANDMAPKLEMSEDNPASSRCDSDLDASTRTDQNGHSEDSNQEDVKTLDNDLEDEFAITPENQAIITSEEHRAPDTPENHRMPWMPEEFEDGKSLSEPRITHALTTRMIQPIVIQCSFTQSRQDKKHKRPLRHSEMTQLRLPSWSQ
ncbi:hypothetical protein EI94DRAFT_1705043 [Lactarius quietus]|nr:hypothetical protein EI94DRAFT_1705043 [Lactarius quietus]